MTRDELLNRAQDIHYNLIDLESESGEITDEQFDLMVELARLMRDFIDNKYHKTYFGVPDTRDFYGTETGLVELDPEIAKAIQILNSKGYKTIASCAGHTKREFFKNGISPGYVWADNYPPGKLPKGLFMCKHGGRPCIRWRPTTSAGLEKAQEALLKYAIAAKPFRSKNDQR